jgi:hypothetical protein
MALNLVLIAAIFAAAWRLHSDWANARNREQSLLSRRVQAQPALPMTPSPVPQPVAATSYSDVAQKMLFSKDRNPTVVIETAAPPPPKPMPPLPVLYGVMNLLNGTTAIMGEKTGARHVGIHPGDQIGEFTLVTITSQEITLEWDGKQITKPVDELIDRSAPPPAQAAGAEAATPRPSQIASSQSPQSSQPSQPSRQQAKVEPAPGAVLNDRLRACQPGDSSPAGTVSGGFKKVVTPSPFGSMCRWEPN